jgi:trk system potassium uptake protein TrkA
MRFVIIGAGSVGRRTASVLRENDHRVTLIDTDGTALEQAAEAGFDVVKNDGPLADVLERAGVESADALGALTDDLNTNFAACVVGKEAGCRTIMRHDEAFGEDIYREHAAEVDEIIHPERLGSVVVENALVGGNIRAIADIQQDLQLVEFTIRDTSPMRGYSLSELELPSEARLLAFGKGDKSVRLPTADDVLDPGDKLVVLTDFRKLDDVRRLITGTTGERALAT